MDPKSWIQAQASLRNELIRFRDEPDRTKLRSLVDHVLDRYEAHYRAQTRFAKFDPVQAFNNPSATNLVRAVYWLSGIRPNILIQLLYTESGLRFEAQLNDLLNGVHSAASGDINPAQLEKIDDLQRRTIKDEVVIDEEMGRVQESVPDPFLPSDSDLDSRLEEIRRVLEEADGLRMKTLRAVLGILDPLQAVDLLIAVADLEIGVRGLGLELERNPIRLWD